MPKIDIILWFMKIFFVLPMVKHNLTRLHDSNSSPKFSCTLPFDRHRKKTPNRRPSSHKKPKRRRKEVVAAKPRRRSGPKEKSGTSWTTKCCSTSRLMRNCTKKFHRTNWSLQASCPSAWRSADRSPGVHSSNCATKVNVLHVRNALILMCFTPYKLCELLVCQLACSHSRCIVLIAQYLVRSFAQVWSSRSSNIMPRLSTPAPPKVTIQLHKANYFMTLFVKNFRKMRAFGPFAHILRMLSSSAQ